MNVDFTSNKNQFIDAKDAAIERALEIIGIKAEKYAKALAPVGTPESTGKRGYRGGTLRNSISHDHDDDTVYVGTNVEYAPYQELGTRYMKAANNGKGYLRPAVQDHLYEYKNIVQSELNG